MSYASTKEIRLKTLLERIDDERLILPEIQRDFVWSKKSVLYLFDSLFRGLPIGHMLVWKAKRFVQSKNFHRRKLRSGDFLDNFEGYLLDGQQRLTALAHVRDADDDYRLMFCIWPDRDKDEDATFVWQKDWNKCNHWYLPVADLLQDRFDILEYLRNVMPRIKKDKDYQPTFEKRIHQDLLKLQQLLDYPVGVIEFETDDYSEATELFIRFNSTGRKLSKSDLFLAELAVKVQGLASKDIHKVAQKWPNFGFTMPFLTQCLLAVCTGRLRTTAKNAWGDYTEKDIREAWRKTERGLGQVIRFLTGSVGWQYAELIPSFNALIPLVVLAAEGDVMTERDTELARRWLLLAGVRGHFSGAVHTEIDRLLRRLNAKMSIRELWRATASDLRKLRTRDFEVSRISGPMTSLYLAMLVDNDARDWCDKHFRLNGKVQGRNAELHVHHFFPKSLLRKHGYGDDVINTFGNYTVLSASANWNVGTEEPATYMKRIEVTEAQLQKQCIPLDRGLWRLDRYEDFLKERRQLLTNATNDFLGF